MQTTQETRLGWLKRILGMDRAKEVESQLEVMRQETREAAAALDAAGIQRKEQADKQPDTDPNDQTQSEDQDAAQADNDPVLKVAQTLTDQIKAAVQGDYSKLTDEGLIATLANVLREAMPPDPIDREETDPEEIVTMDDNEKQLKPADMSEATKAITGALDALVRDQGEIAKAYTAQQAELTELKSLKPAVEELTKTVNAMQALLQHPRSASAADETEPELGEAERKALEEQIMKGIDGTPKVFLGVPVKSIPK